MRIAVINETSAADKNAAVIAALEGRGHEVLNVGMTKGGAQPELTYIHTGFLSALLLNTGAVDLVVGGCGTGMGYLNSALQYPNVFCGLLKNSLDAWLFAQINGGNCVSLPLNYEYGWAGDVNLQFLFDKLFSVEFGCGYPEARKTSQAWSRDMLQNASIATHKSFAQIINDLPDEIANSLNYPGIFELLAVSKLQDKELAAAITARIA